MKAIGGEVVSCDVRMLCSKLQMQQQQVLAVG